MQNIKDTHFNEATPAAVRNILERARYSGARLKLYYGDAITGRDWMDESGKIGRIGRSTGSNPIPLLLANRRIHGGGGILCHCIVKIKQDGVELYRHPSYYQPKIEIVPSDMAGYSHNVNIGGKNYSRHKTERSAKLLVAKLS